MPINVIIGLVSLLVALVLYSMGVWGAFRSKSVSRRQVMCLFAGFAFDVLATAMMAISAGGLDLSPMSDLIHTLLAFVVMFGMLAAAILASRAISSGDSKMAVSLAKWMTVPWAAWVLMFLWGLASRGSARMG